MTNPCTVTKLIAKNFLSQFIVKLFILCFSGRGCSLLEQSAWSCHFHTFCSCLLLQCVNLACYAERCISCDRFCLTDRPTNCPSDHLSVTVRYHAKTTPATIMRSSLEDSPMILVSWLLTSARNSKGIIESEGAEWERGSKNVAKIGNF